jgi:hypothetical protein
MENKTKIYIGVGAAALVAFLLFRNKAVAQKPSGGGTGGTTGGTGKDAPCPEGQTRIQPNCIKAPCPSECIPDNIDDWMKPKNEKPKGCPAGTREVDIACIVAPCPSMCLPISFEDDVLPAPMPPTPMPRPNYPKFPINESESYRDNMYYQNLFQQGGGVYQKELL